MVLRSSELFPWSFDAVQRCPELALGAPKLLRGALSVLQRVMRCYRTALKWFSLLPNGMVFHGANLE